MVLWMVYDRRWCDAAAPSAVAINYKGVVVI